MRETNPEIIRLWAAQDAAWALYEAEWRIDRTSARTLAACNAYLDTVEALRAAERREEAAHA